MKPDLSQYGLSSEDFDRACQILDRTPNHTELGMIGAMWSEHCSYKSSKIHLKKFPTEGPRVLEGPGENAGVVDIGEGLACVFKVESHNHPSFIEPYQGAATGVGGILRDVFTMGARPIASLNSLRFGEPQNPRTRHLVSGVVAGIGDYGNCIGVPTVGGEASFHPSYNGNILVNAFTLGLVRSDQYFTAKAQGVGNPIFYVGSRTGRDGIQGATMASESFDTADPEAQEKRPTVQVGDPFTEKLLLEACLELMQTDAIIGIQDMGAAGLTSSSFEMAGRGGTGVKLDIDAIPARETAMSAYDFMLSESQERMLIVAKPGREKQIQDIFHKWGLQACQIGEVTDDGQVTLLQDGNCVAQLPALPLAQGSPEYDRPQKKPDYLEALQTVRLTFDEPTDLAQTVLDFMASPNLCSRAWIYEQYDQTVRTNTVQGSGGDAAVMRIKESREGRGLAISSDVNPRYCYLNPHLGGQLSVAEAARNLACVGAHPIGTSNCLNFGNPENPEVMWQFSQCVEGMTEALDKLQTPIVSGNVSFYNETDGQGIHPTPTVVMVGLINDVERALGAGFKNEGDLIFLLGGSQLTLEASEYVAYFHQKEIGQPLAIDWKLEKNVQALTRDLVENRQLSSAHDLSDGGLAIALAESTLLSPGQSLGAEIDLKGSANAHRLDTLWFGEGPSRILVSLPEKAVENLMLSAQKFQVPVRHLGQVTLGHLVLADHQQKCRIEIKTMVEASQALNRYMSGHSFGYQKGSADSCLK